MQRYLVPAVLALLLLAAGCASQEMRGPKPSGGPGGQGRPSAEKMISEMKTRLSLTDEQAAQVDPLLREQFDKVKALMEENRSSGREPSDAMRNEMKDLRWEFDKELSKILTEDQMIAYTKWRDEMDARQTGDRPAPPQGGPGGGMPPRR